MKRVICVMVFIVGLLTLAGCGQPVEPASPGGDENSQAPVVDSGVTFTDDLGRTVTVESPERVAVTIGSFADIWCLAGGKDVMVATANDAWTEFDLGLDETVVNLGGVKEPNMEALFSVEPDLVIASSNTTQNVDMLETLERAGINVAYFNVSSFQDYLRMLEICCQITGQRENYHRYGAQLTRQIEAAQERISGEPPRVLYIRASGSSCKVKNSRDNVLGEMLADLGCVNIADSQTSLLENLSMEAIAAADPDFIFVVLQGADPAKAEKMLRDSLLSNPAWNDLTAVREGRFISMDPHLYNLKPNARWGEAYEGLAEILYPETAQ